MGGGGGGGVSIVVVVKKRRRCHRINFRLCSIRIIGTAFLRFVRGCASNVLVVRQQQRTFLPNGTKDMLSRS